MGVYCRISYRWIVTDGICLPCVVQVQFKTNKITVLFLMCGLCVGANLFIMSFANMYDHLKLHVLTASIVFQLGIVWAILSHFALPGKNKPRKKSGYTQS